MLPLLVLAGVCGPVVADADFAATQAQGLARFDGGVRLDALTALSTGPDAGIARQPGSRFGVMDSPVFDVQQVTRWTSVGWTTARPSGVRLPDDGGTEPFRLDAMDLTGNVSLYHLDEAAWTALGSCPGADAGIDGGASDAGSPDAGGGDVGTGAAQDYTVRGLNGAGGAGALAARARRAPPAPHGGQC